MSAFSLKFVLLAVAGPALAISEMHDRQFAFPRGLLEDYESEMEIDRTKPPSDAFAPDPFATTPLVIKDKPPRLPASARQILERNGIPFPEGSSCVFDPLTGMLRVRNTQPNLDLVEELFFGMNCCHGASGIAWHLIVVEGAEAAVREAEKTTSHFPSAHRSLEKLLSDGNTRVVGDAFLEGPGGSRIQHHSGTTHAQTGVPVRDKSGRLQVPLEFRHSGLDLVIECIIGPDGITIETTVSLKLQTSPPLLRQSSITDPVSGGTVVFSAGVFDEVALQTSYTSTAGSTKLLGLAKSNTAGRLCAAFLTSSLRHHDCAVYRSLFRPAPPEWKAKAPAGMAAIVFAPPAGLLELAMREKPRLSFLAWLESQGIAAAGAVAEPHDGGIHLIHTPESIERIARLFDSLLAERPMNLVFTLQTIQAPASLLRPLVRKHLHDRDHAALLREVEGSGRSTTIDFVSLQGRDGSRVNHERGLELGALKRVFIRSSNIPELDLERMRCGSRLQIEATLDPSHVVVRANLDYDLHAAAPDLRRLAFAAHGMEKQGELPLHDQHHSQTISGVRLESGRQRLIALHQPAKGEAADMLQATFLCCDIVPQIPLPTPPAPAPEKRQPPANPGEIQTRTFKVPKDFLTEGAVDGPKKTAKEILTQFGITFPEGASATHMPRPSVLVVRNTAANLDLIETFLEADCLLPSRIVSVTTHVFEAPEAFVRDLHAQTLAQSHHADQLTAMEAAVKAGTATQLDTARLEARAGNRATFDQGIERSVLESIAVDERGDPQFKFWKRHDGFHVELEPSLPPDGEMIDLTIFTESPIKMAVERREHLFDTRGKRIEFPLTDFNSTSVTTGHTIPAGATQMLGVWRPDAAKDVLRVVFVTARLETVSLTKE